MLSTSKKETIQQKVFENQIRKNAIFETLRNLCNYKKGLISSQSMSGHLKLIIGRLSQLTTDMQGPSKRERRIASYISKIVSHLDTVLTQPE